METGVSCAVDGAGDGEERQAGAMDGERADRLIEAYVQRPGAGADRPSQFTRAVDIVQRSVSPETAERVR